ncbi:hypothetical protein [Engelhardtia mirabilis]|uniref:Rod shape-determining protein MreD n=1 Tax=Engelhardtia mirabilis TaxID=2528011 RepID=A0A518BPY8_9BACT|nr:hypothetical protein Pla133_41440 [Planctomycetes bacterium Pla133]QDV03355.1 hypothetical protein Pla86_41430 [Planctomycetes bacterium Pla86]
MSGGLVGWACLLLWSAWAFAAQGVLARSDLFASWTPDVGVVLLVGLASRMTPERARAGAVLLALTRAGLSGDPVVAVLAAYLALVVVVSSLRASVNTDGTVLRGFLSGLGALAVVGWLALVDLVRADTPVGWSQPLGEWAWRAAFSTALLSFVFGGWLRRLPGLGPLWRKERPWGFAEPAR